MHDALGFTLNFTPGHQVDRAPADIAGLEEHRDRTVPVHARDEMASSCLLLLSIMMDPGNRVSVPDSTSQLWSRVRIRILEGRTQGQPAGIPGHMGFQASQRGNQSTFL